MQHFAIFLGFNAEFAQECIPGRGRAAGLDGGPGALDVRRAASVRPGRAAQRVEHPVVGAQKDAEAVSAGEVVAAGIPADERASAANVEEHVAEGRAIDEAGTAKAGMQIPAGILAGKEDNVLDVEGPAGVYRQQVEGVLAKAAPAGIGTPSAGA